MCLVIFHLNLQLHAENKFYILCVFYDYLYSTAIPTVRSTGCAQSLDVFILC